MKTRTSREGSPADRSWLNRHSKLIIGILSVLVVPYSGWNASKDIQAYFANPINNQNTTGEIVQGGFEEQVTHAFEVNSAKFTEVDERLDRLEAQSTRSDSGLQKQIDKLKSWHE